CLLVSHYWCKLVVPILWHNPFHYWWRSSSRPVENVIENNWHLLRRTYIATLNEVEKEILHPYDRRYNPSQPLFQYSAYLENFSFADITKIIVEDDTLLATLIEKAGKTLLNLQIDKVSGKVVMSLSQFCPNISKFTLEYEVQNYSMFMDYLKGSSISQLVIKSYGISIDLLNGLARYVPSSLEEIYLCCHFKPDFLMIFLLDYSALSFNTLKTLCIKDLDGYSHEYLKVIERYSVYNAFKTIVIETMVCIDESSDLIQNIGKKGINVVLQEVF
ncbi:17781_t:CDS:2, partial [Acaulospora morrowiae]